MTVIEIIDTFTFYGVDVICLAALTAVLVQILKLTLLKKVQKKIITFLPFTIGTLLYAIYAAVRNLSLYYLIEEYTSILEHGVSVGAAAMLFYVFYEQFVRIKQAASSTESVISALIEGYVPTDKTETVAKLVCEAIEKDVTGNGAKRTAEILAENSTEDITEQDVQLLAKLIIETLAHISTT